jgi:amidohydrolase
METMDLKKKIYSSVDSHRDRIIELGRTIYANPETGFKEFKTSSLVEEKFREMKVDIVKPDNIPGFKVVIDTGTEGPSIAILAELDAIICADHPDSDTETGAAHACGHNIQAASVYGTALGLLYSDAVEHLCGKINFIYVPAEEGIEIGYRMNLREKGIISYLNGKPEFMKRGMFDDVDISFMLHATSGEKRFYTAEGSNGCIIKDIRYIGKTAHAGGNPDKGINALYAANLGLSAINSIRETFREDQYIRVHPIITKGGDAVNVIPSDVRISTYVRGKTLEAITDANRKVDMALAGGAISMGAKVEIFDIPGYMPLINDSNLMSLAKNSIAGLLNGEDIGHRTHATGSTDMGDISMVMPAIHPNVGGTEGTFHGSDYRITDEETAYILSSKILASIAVELLSENGKKAVEIKNNYKPYFASIRDYLEYTESLFKKQVLPKCDCWI